LQILNCIGPRSSRGSSEKRRSEQKCCFEASRPPSQRFSHQLHLASPSRANSAVSGSSIMWRKNLQGKQTLLRIRTECLHPDDAGEQPDKPHCCLPCGPATSGGDRDGTDCECDIYTSQPRNALGGRPRRGKRVRLALVSPERSCSRGFRCRRRPTGWASPRDRSRPRRLKAASSSPWDPVGANRCFCEVSPPLLNSRAGRGATHNRFSIASLVMTFRVRQDRACVELNSGPVEGRQVLR